MKKQINDLLLKMQTGENCIGETGNKLFDLFAFSGSSSFVCQGCKCEVPNEFSVKTDGYCYLCDPKVTLEECLQDGCPEAWRQLPGQPAKLLTIECVGLSEKPVCPLCKDPYITYTCGEYYECNSCGNTWVD